MNYLRFNRHEIFDSALMDRVRDVLNEVQNYLIDTDQSPINSISNMISGLYDGYLYDDLQMEAMNYPIGIYSECVDIVSEILKRIKLQES